ncbi:alkaline shock response membrane anchor protein AmaP [Geodermatophilus sp. DSM 44513]|uniref:alkaline shock response membrane anchor protein AmaP n=1 Tax=Geodermatophilus sp. DSM 44513 TaxID=1528104 RepID=UPI001277C9EA|nr:alkaline shock response membrane anchor protein AmaP [Geodermatophilus sp. DSM 44513]WNV75124.1 alkaline shock response membrane anchor protein AmaP [Geodermatophilus sp. DSM 44513]
MSRRVDTANRTVLALLGLLLAGGGGVGLAAGSGAFGDPPPVLPEQARAYPGEQPWFWWAVAGGCLLVALLALRWLLAQLHTDRVGRLDLTRDDRDGRTVVHAGALADAVEAEARSLRGVLGASARVVEHRGRTLRVAVELADHADVAEVRRVLEDRVVAHARQAVDDPDLPVDVELRPGRRAGSRGLR